MLNFLKKDPLKNHVQSEMSPYDEHALKILLNKFERTNLRILEIGSWFGKGSTTVFSNYADKIVCVDHWQGNENETHRLLAKETVPFQIFKKNTTSFSGKIIAVHTHSSNINDLFARESFDLVFIDGDHRHQQTRNDILNTVHLVKKGGILCGHDCEGRPSDSNMDLLKDRLENDHCESIFMNFKEMHPGVILAVDECVEGASLFAEMRFHLTINGKEQSGCSSIWYKQI